MVDLDPTAYQFYIKQICIDNTHMKENKVIGEASLYSPRSLLLEHGVLHSNIQPPTPKELLS